MYLETNNKKLDKNCDPVFSILTLGYEQSEKKHAVRKIFAKLSKRTLEKRPIIP